MADVLNCDIVASDSYYYVNFQTDTIGKGINSLIPRIYRLNSTTTVLQKE